MYYQVFWTLNWMPRQYPNDKIKILLNLFFIDLIILKSIELLVLSSRTQKTTFRVAFGLSIGFLLVKIGR